MAPKNERGRGGLARGGTPASKPTRLAAQQQTPTPLHIPNPGDPLYMAPDSAGRGSMEPTPASAASSSRLGTQAARSPTRSPGPLQLPGGSILNAPTWPSVKNLDMLSASERVLHNNMACLAFRLDQIQNALVHIASGRGAAGKATTEQVDPAIVENDKNIALQLESQEYVGILRDLMNQFKGQRGTLTITRGRKGNADKQANDFLELLGSRAVEEHEDRESTMETGGEDNEQEPSPSSNIHALACGFSQKGLTDWTIQLIKNFKLGPQKAPAAAKTGSKRKVGEEGDDEDEEDSEGEDGQGDGGARPITNPKKKSRKLT